MAKSLDIIDPKKDMSDRSEDDNEEDKDLDLDSPKKEKGSGGGVFYLVLGIIAILVATAAALFILFREDGSNKDPNLSSVTATAVAESSPSATATESAEIAAPENPSSESGFEYTDESIRIANGNGINGEASKIKGVLEEKGYKVASVGNASRSYTESIIYFKTGQDKLAEALKKDLAGEYKFTTEAADQVVGSYDAVIVLGSK